MAGYTFSTTCSNDRNRFIYLSLNSFPVNPIAALISQIAVLRMQIADPEEDVRNEIEDFRAQIEQNRADQWPSVNLKDDVFDPVEFIYRLQRQIPDKGEVMIRYYGYYSNASRGKRNRDRGEKNVPVPMGEDFLARKELRKRWAARIKKVYEIDPLILILFISFDTILKIEIPTTLMICVKLRRCCDNQPKMKTERQQSPSSRHQ